MVCEWEMKVDLKNTITMNRVISYVFSFKFSKIHWKTTRRWNNIVTFRCFLWVFTTINFHLIWFCFEWVEVYLYRCFLCFYAEWNKRPFSTHQQITFKTENEVIEIYLANWKWKRILPISSHLAQQQFRYEQFFLWPRKPDMIPWLRHRAHFGTRPLFAATLFWWFDDIGNWCGFSLFAIELIEIGNISAWMNRWRATPCRVFVRYDAFHYCELAKPQNTCFLETI